MQPARYTENSAHCGMNVARASILLIWSVSLVVSNGYVIPPVSHLRRRGALHSFTTMPRRLPLQVGALPLGDAILHGKVGALATSLFRVSGQVPFLQALGINVVLFATFRRKLFTALTTGGYFHAMALGTLLWMTLGWRGWSFCVLYLVMGQLVTKVKFADKARRGIAESRGGRRGPENVWGSAATSLFCAIGSVHGSSFLPRSLSPNLFLLGYVAALSTKLADTFASEIGKAYGKTTFLITNLKRVEPGTEGAISVEGTAAAAFGGFLLSMFGYCLGFIELPSVVVSTFAAFFATNVESLIGATLQGREGFSFMTNEVVNFLNTLIGACVAIALGKTLLKLA
jgi:uncharacterized protein (TIGR00297 family)